MSQRLLSLCGVIAPLLFAFTAILGGALRPGYSHFAETVSELFSPGSPNKPLLDSLYTLFALLLVLFGVGILRFVRTSGSSSRLGITGAALYITMGLVGVTTATIFPQDPWGSAVTFPGQMHMLLSGMVGLLTILSMLCLGTWFKRAGLFPGFGTYSYLTAGGSVVLTGFFAAMTGTPIMGLAERLAILVGFAWTTILGLWLFSKSG